MNIQEHTTPERLERYTFLWSLARMVIAALSLFFGATPIVYRIIESYSIYYILLLFWFISGVAVIYLLYTWFKSGQTLFGSNEKKDLIFFLIMGVTGLNLGFAAISTNVGMGVVSGMPIDDIVFKATALVYLFVAYSLWKRWKDNGERLFVQRGAATVSTPAGNTNKDEVPGAPSSL